MSLQQKQEGAPEQDRVSVSLFWGEVTVFCCHLNHHVKCLYTRTNMRLKLFPMFSYISYVIHLGSIINLHHWCRDCITAIKICYHFEQRQFIVCFILLLVGISEVITLCRNVTK